MAWQRTALGVGGVSALLLHQTRGSVLTALPGLVGLGVATVLLTLTEVRYERTVQRVGAGRDAAAAHMALLLAGTVSILAIVSIGLILVDESP